MRSRSQCFNVISCDQVIITPDKKNTDESGRKSGQDVPGMTKTGLDSKVCIINVECFGNFSVSVVYCPFSKFTGNAHWLLWYDVTQLK